jgi:putative endonuclease
MAGLLNRLLGNEGERRAAKYLRGLGYRILARQSSGRIGEIDLIALEGETIVFVEVKTRRSQAAGHPVEAVTPAKQRKLTNVALAYLKRHGLLERRARFDVVTIIWPSGARHPEITHYRNAFEPTGFGQMFS